MARLRWRVLATALVLGAAPARAQQPADGPATGGADSEVVQWARPHAVLLHGVDAPYDDASFAFLRPLVGKAHILAVGELIHGTHQPLAFRNEVIRYAVSHLGVTGVAVESGFTEAAIVDRFIQDGTGNIDSVVRTGFTWSFETLPENRALVLWLRSYNAGAAHKVRFYGLDLSGTDDNGFMPRARGAVLAALECLAAVDRGAHGALHARLLPLMDRFLPARYAEYSPTDRDGLKAALDSLYQVLLADSGRAVASGAGAAYPRGLRNAWMAVRINEIMARNAAGPADQGSNLLRDSTMAENTRWVRAQQKPDARILVFAHDFHVMDTDPVYDGQHVVPLGRFLRARYDSDLVVLASAAGTIVGGIGGIGGWVGDSGEAHAGPTSFAGTLARVGPPVFVLDLRQADAVPHVAAALAQPWPFVPHDPMLPIVPRQAFDAVVYFDRVTPAKAH